MEFHLRDWLFRRPGKNVYFPSSWARFPSSRADFPQVWDGFPYVYLYFFPPNLKISWQGTSHFAPFFHAWLFRTENSPSGKSSCFLIETLYRENVSFRDRDLKRLTRCHIYVPPCIHLFPHARTDTIQVVEHEPNFSKFYPLTISFLVSQFCTLESSLCVSSSDYYLISPFGSSLIKVVLNPKIRTTECTHQTTSVHRMNS